MLDEQMIIVGRLGKAHGLQGFVKVQSYTEPPENILDYPVWYLQMEGHWQLQTVEASRTLNNQLIAKIKGYDDPESARQLTNAAIAISREYLPALAKDEFYHADLIGCTVTNLKGIVLGKVESMLITAGQDLLSVQGTRDYLIPFRMNEYIVSVDLNAHTIQVDWDEDF